MEIWRVESFLPLIATLFLGVVIIGTGVSILYMLYEAYLNMTFSLYKIYEQTLTMDMYVL